MSLYKDRTRRPDGAIVESCTIIPDSKYSKIWEMTVDIYGRVHVDFIDGHLQLGEASQKDLIKLARMFRKAAQAFSPSKYGGLIG